MQQIVAGSGKLSNLIIEKIILFDQVMHGKRCYVF